MASLASAQSSPVDKGSMIVGGSAYFMSHSGDLYEDGEGNGITSIYFQPEIGYFMAPNIMIGGFLLYNSTSQDKYKVSSFGIGPQVGYYFNMDKGRTEIKGSVYPYIKGFLSYAKTTEDEGDDEDYKYSMTSFGARGGIMYMLSEAVAVDFGLQYSSNTCKQTDPEVPEGMDDSESGSSLMIGAGITAFIWK
jgi:hypothetical protein